MRSLELVQPALPSSVELYSNFYASENHLLSTLEVDSQLHDIAVTHYIWFRLCPRRTQSDVIEKSA